MWGRRGLLGYLCQGAVIAIAAGLALIRFPAARVERLFSNGIYASFQPLVTSLSNRTEYALLDPLILGFAALWLVLSVGDLARRQRFLRKTARISWRTMVWSAALYVAFMCVWGFNYRRQPLAEKLAFQPDAVTADAARAMADASVDQANLLHEPAHAPTADHH